MMMGQNRTTSRRRAGALVGVIAVVALAGCASTPVSGTAFADQVVTDALAAERFDAQMALLELRINENTPFASGAQTDITGVSFAHATHGDRKTSGQSVVAVRGNPVSLFVQQTDSKEGFTLDTLHIGGESVDYLLLGDSYASLAPTRWVAVPTSYGTPGEDILLAGLRNMCFITGFGTTCQILRTIQSTAESDLGARMRRSVQTDVDGTVHSQTEVTLAAVVAEASLIDIPPEVSVLFTPEMLDSFIPVSIWQDADGNLIKMEMNGTVPGTDGVADFVVQLGFEIAGKATASDIPQAPSPWDVTVLDEAETAAFYDAYGELT